VREIFLTAHRVDGYDGTGTVENFKQLGNGGDLVRLAIQRLLAQDQAVLAGPGAGKIQCVLAVGWIEPPNHVNLDIDAANDPTHDRRVLSIYRGNIDMDAGNRSLTAMAALPSRSPASRS